MFRAQKNLHFHLKPKKFVDGRIRHRNKIYC